VNEKELTHIDLFSGVGGFTLAAEWAGFKTIAFCEKEKFCQKVLKKHWPGIPIIEEIRDVDGTKYRGATLLTGGFPCQPFSVAGKRKGKEDDRYLWPEMFRVISKARPCWILAENVPGIFHMALDTVLADLEGEGYTTGTFIIPACGLNAPHRRNRIWIIGYSTINGHSGRREKARGAKRESKQGGLCKFEGTDSHASNSKSRLSGKQAEQKRGEDFGGRDIEIITDSEASLIRGIRNKGKKEGSQDSDELLGDSYRLLWQEDWHEVAARFCRVDDGIPDRIHRLKALGNAIVPQIAYEILKNIAWIEWQNHSPGVKGE